MSSRGTWGALLAGLTSGIVWSGSGCAVRGVPQPEKSHQPAGLAGFLDSAAPAEMSATRIPGAAIAVVVDDSIVYARGFGVASVETGIPVTAETLFRIASTTKMLTAAAVLAVAAGGKLNLDAPQDSLFSGRAPALGRLTLRDLLRHRAGLREGSSYYGPHDDDALGRFVRSWSDTVLFTTPGDIYSYSNLGYSAAGAALERATGLAYADAMAETVFRPLGMTRSTLRPTEAMTYPFAQGHDLGADGKPAVVRPFSDDVRYWPAGSVFTSATEFARFILALLNDGRVGGAQALPAAVARQMFTRQSDLPGSAPSEHAGYSLGLVIRDLRGLRVYQHGGVRIGFGTVVRVLPERRAGIVILANRTNGLLLGTLEGATRLLAPGGAEAARDDTPVSGPLSDAEMSAAAGRYVNAPGDWEFDLVVRAGRLWLRRVGATGESPVTKLPDGRYFAAGQTFVITEGDRGSGRYVHLAGHALRKR